MQPLEVYVDDETKLTLHGLQQHYVKLLDKEKNRKLFDLLDVLEFNQVGLGNVLHVDRLPVDMEFVLRGTFWPLLCDSLCGGF